MPYTFVFGFGVFSLTLWFMHGTMKMLFSLGDLFYIFCICINLFYLVLVNMTDIAATVQVTAFVLLADLYVLCAASCCYAPMILTLLGLFLTSISDSLISCE